MKLNLLPTDVIRRQQTAFLAKITLPTYLPTYLTTEVVINDAAESRKSDLDQIESNVVGTNDALK